MTSKIVAVLGCGVIGSSWIEAFLSKGHIVRAWDPNLETCASIADRYQDTVQIFNTPEVAVQEAVFIQESGPEVLETKQELFSRVVSSVGVRSIVASSTSTLQPTQVQ